MEILWLTHTASATGDYYFHENDKLTVFTCHPQNGWWVLGFIMKHSSPQPSPCVYTCVCEDASLVSLDIWLPFYPVPRMVSQMLCDRSTPSYQSSFTLTQPQRHKDTSSSCTLKMIISYKIQASPARLKAGVCLLKLTRKHCIKSPSQPDYSWLLKWDFFKWRWKNRGTCKTFKKKVSEKIKLQTSSSCWENCHHAHYQKQILNVKIKYIHYEVKTVVHCLLLRYKLRPFKSNEKRGLLSR